MFIPTNQKLTTVTEALDEARFARMEALSKITAVNSLRTNIEASQQKLADHQALIREFMQTENLEAEFTKFMVQNNLHPVTVMLEIVEPETQAAEVPSDLIKFTMNVHCRALSHEALENVLNLPDYVNGVYSFRLVDMDLIIKNDPIGILSNLDPDKPPKVFADYAELINSFGLEYFDGDTLASLLSEVLVFVEADFNVETVLRVMP